jgi:ABC-type transport system involved in cytochrome bd biosynthesis fused ATPase/permease subunit
MDQILVMKNGELEAAGSYSQVRTLSSVFRELEELQWAELK